jgi:uncharacterized protein with HEPN domain
MEGAENSGCMRLTDKTISDVSLIIGFRNVLAHDYDDVDAWQIWGTIENDLPSLLAVLMQLLGNAPGP